MGKGTSKVQNLGGIITTEKKVKTLSLSMGVFNPKAIQKIEARYELKRIMLYGMNVWPCLQNQLYTYQTHCQQPMV